MKRTESGNYYRLKVDERIKGTDFQFGWADNKTASAMTMAFFEDSENIHMLSQQMKGDIYVSKETRKDGELVSLSVTITKDNKVEITTPSGERIEVAI